MGKRRLAPKLTLRRRESPCHGKLLPVECRSGDYWLDSESWRIYVKGYGVWRLDGHRVRPASGRAITVAGVITIKGYRRPDLRGRIKRGRWEALPPIG